MSRTLLIDADFVCYQATAGSQSVIDWNGDGSVVSIDARLKEAKQKVQNTVDWMMDNLKATDCVICLSDEVVNFRKRDIDPTYKGNRKDVERPVYLYDLKDWMGERWGSRIIPTLEADDVMGILSTEPHTGERIIVSNDKDMRTIPGLLCAPPMLDASKKFKVEEISEGMADRFHLFQTIVGDVCDGYPGCPGAGPKAALDVLAGRRWFQQERTLKSGPRKGLTLTEWVYEDDVDGHPWPLIVALYEKAGLTAAHALRQARLAFILRSSHFVDGKRLEWNPPKTAVS